jgi:hypothetical protein
MLAKQGVFINWAKEKTMSTISNDNFAAGYFDNASCGSTPCLRITGPQRPVPRINRGIGAHA